MPNLATAFVRVFHTSGNGRVTIPEILNVLLHGTGGTTGSSPLYIRENIQHQFSDIQFVAKWDAVRYIKYLWAIYGKNTLSSDETPEWLSPFLTSDNQGKLSCVWYREANEKSSLDIIGVLKNSTEILETQLCLYAFDSVKIQWLDKIKTTNNNCDEDDINLFSQQYGTFRSYNPYYGFGDVEPIVSPTTPVHAYSIETDVFINYPSFAYWEMPDCLVKIEAEIWEKAKVLEFFWKGRIVRKFLRCTTPFGNDGWAEYNLDYWDNCVNPEWLTYKQEIGLEE